MPYQILADWVLAVHLAVVVFVVGGALAVVIGNRIAWIWVNHWRFRLAHLAAVVVIVLHSWLGQLCPLTVLESWLRLQASAQAYEKSFIEHWVQRLIYFEAPFWVFALIYTVFAAVVVLMWWRYPTRRSGSPLDQYARISRR